MDKGQTLTLEIFINNWNVEFPQHPLKPDDLKQPHALMQALFQVFDRLGIAREAVLAPPQDENESVRFYWDLVPVINMTRVITYLVSLLPQSFGAYSIMHFLQPKPNTSRWIMVLPFNLMLFNKERLNEIAPNEETLFAKTEHVKNLESKKNKLLGLLNKQAEEKALRAGRLEKLRPDVKQYEEDLKNEKEIHNEEKQVLELILKENKQTELLIEQKKLHRDALMAEVARKKALRVYDAEDTKAQAEQAALNVQEAEEKLNALRTTLMQKENSLKNLQTIKPSLDTANNLLHEIMKLTDSLKDYETGDLDSDSKEGELDVLKTELSEIQVQLSELQAARAEAAGKRREAHAKRLSDKSQALRALHEAEEKDKKCRSRCKKAAQRTNEIKERTLTYEKEKAEGMETLAVIKDTFCAKIESLEKLYINNTMEVKKRMEEKLRRRNL